MRKCKVFLLLLLLAPLQILSAPRPRPAPQPAPFTPGLKIGALAGAALVIKALLLSNVLAGEKEEHGGHFSPAYGPPSSYGAPSYEPPPIITHYDPPTPSVEYGPPPISYKPRPSYHHDHHHDDHHHDDHHHG